MNIENLMGDGLGKRRRRRKSKGMGKHKRRGRKICVRTAAGTKVCGTRWRRRRKRR